MEIVIFILIALILTPFVLAFERKANDVLPSLTREAKQREKEIVALTKVRVDLDEQISDRLQHTSDYSRKRILKQLERR